MRTYRLGEKKDCGVIIASSDGSPFVITNATFVYSNAGTTLSSGAALIDTVNKKVFVALQPTAIASKSICTFTVTAQGADSNGNPDPAKTAEILKYDVIVKVTN